MNRKATGKLIIIGGHEDKLGDRKILEAVSQDAIEKKGGLLIVTVASSLPDELSKEYVKVFKSLGVKQVDVLDIRDREEAKAESARKKLENASVIFFTGGDQLRLTSQIGDTPVFQNMEKRLKEGGTVAGTSAGAAAMPETMIVSGESDASHKVFSLDMAPGLALIRGVVIDSHFAERGRIGRLLGAVANNPKNLGIGIDEDTAIIIDGDSQFQVIGSGAVYVVDGTGISYSSLSEEDTDGVVSIYNVKVHVLSEGDWFDLQKRQPEAAKPQEVNGHGNGAAHKGNGKSKGNKMSNGKNGNGREKQKASHNEAQKEAGN